MPYNWPTLTEYNGRVLRDSYIHDSPAISSGSRQTARAYFVEVTLPTDPSQRASLVDRYGFGRQRSQSEVNRLTLGRKLISAHHLGAGPFIDV